MATFSRFELKQLWRALAALPPHHTRHDGLVGFRREPAARVATPDAPTDFGAFDDEPGHIVLYDAAFDHGNRAETFDFKVAELVGQSLHRGLRRELGVRGIERFGVLYARFVHDQPALAAEDPTTFAHLAEVFATEPTEPAELAPDELARRAALAAAAAFDASRDEVRQWTVGPPPFTHAARTLPFVFLQGYAPEATPPLLAAVYHAPTQQLLFQSAEAFGFYLDALQYVRQPEVLSADELLVAWSVITLGQPPTRVPDFPGSHRVVPTGFASRTTRTTDGALVTDGWTRQDGLPHRHIIRVWPDGTVETSTHPLSPRAPGGQP